MLGDCERQLQAFREAAPRDSAEEAHARIEEARTRLLEAEAQWGDFQREIAAQHPVTEGQAYELSRVQRNLRPEEALVGWLDVQGQGPDARSQSWGYVVRNNGPVQWKRLEPLARADPGDRLKRRADQLRTHSGQTGVGTSELSVAEGLRLEVSRRPVALGSEIHNAGLLWQERLGPLVGNLMNVEHVIVIPSGPMLGIPVEALSTGVSGETFGERFAVSYAPSGTFYAWLVERSAEERRLGESATPATDENLCLVVGDPPFSEGDLAAMAAGADPAATGSDTGDGLFRSVPSAAGSLGVEEDLLMRSALSGNRETRRDLRRLPATRAEATAVASLHGVGSRLLLGSEASEPELARMAAAGKLRGYRTIHIATHALVDDERLENSALVLSQVDLPDALEAAMNGTRIYDGCVTAGEIVREWELDADLVTLSACETALGKKVAGEGYIGLAHAFLQAGARSLLVSLWRVDDRSTSMLMERFYENLLGGYVGRRGLDSSRASGASMSKVEALREAKHWLREWQDTDGSRPYAHPYYWAGFVLIGEAE